MRTSFACVVFVVTFSLTGCSCAADPHIGTACTVGIGACARQGTWQHISGAIQCSATAGMPTAEICDGLDNDCNGLVDDSPGGNESPGRGRLSRSCYPFLALPGVGVCRTGIQICSNGHYGTCSRAVGPSAEICGDGLDNDCDMGIDEACHTTQR